VLSEGFSKREGCSLLEHLRGAQVGYIPFEDYVGARGMVGPNDLTKSMGAIS